MKAFSGSISSINPIGPPYTYGQIVCFHLQDCLYHHPVHKISFIAQDMTDNRAFGYIYGSPENGHRFFGIKTEKAAGAVVVAMRDLFQVVFELKKKEMDEAKRQLGRDKEVGHESLKTFMLLIHRRPHVRTMLVRTILDVRTKF